MLILGVDTSNYATSLAVLDAASMRLVCDVKRFLPVREGQLGLRQSDAVFHHTQALPELLAELGKQVDLRKIGAMGVSARPRPVDGSYMPCFTTGVTFAKGMTMLHGVPLIMSTHQQGHIASALFACGEPELFERETLVFHVSGGTTDLLHCKGEQVLAQLGTSSDLYAGQAVDRIGVRLGFAFPAGVEVSRLALTCEEEIHPKVSVRGCTCSLSGLENQCVALLEKGCSPAYVAKFCLLAVARTLEKMMLAALREHPGLPVIFAGGVMSSPVVRAYMQKKHPAVRFVDGKFASDNAIGISVIAARSLTGSGQAASVEVSDEEKAAAAEEMAAMGGEQP